MDWTKPITIKTHHDRTPAFNLAPLPKEEDEALVLVAGKQAWELPETTPTIRTRRQEVGGCVIKSNSNTTPEESGRESVWEQWAKEGGEWFMCEPFPPFNHHQHHTATLMHVQRTRERGRELEREIKHTLFFCEWRKTIFPTSSCRSSHSPTHSAVCDCRGKFSLARVLSFSRHSHSFPLSDGGASQSALVFKRFLAFPPRRKQGLLSRGGFLLLLLLLLLIPPFRWTRLMLYILYGCVCVCVLTLLCGLCWFCWWVPLRRHREYVCLRFTPRFPADFFGPLLPGSGVFLLRCVCVCFCSLSRTLLESEFIFFGVACAILRTTKNSYSTAEESEKKLGKIWRSLGKGERGPIEW